MNLGDVLQNILEQSADDWTEQDRLLAAQIAADYTQLMARDLAGEDVTQELAMTKAAARNLAAGAAVTGAAIFQRTLNTFLTALISRIGP